MNWQPEGTPERHQPPAFFVSADWSKYEKKRSVYVADLRERRIRSRRPEGGREWNLKSLLVLARELSARGSVLVGIDLALGVSRGFWRLMLDAPGQNRPASFIHWLRGHTHSRRFFRTATDPSDWRVDQPWFEVPSGPGGLGKFTKKVDDGFLRRVERATSAKPLFAVSGIPGTVGSGTRDFWRELVPWLNGERDFTIWPFEGQLDSLLASRGIVFAETYPGLAYAAGLADRLPSHRIRVSKSDRKEVGQNEREKACEILERAAWVKANDVDLGDLALARAGEDDFDAHLTAAAVLRCVIENVPLVASDWVDGEVEGSMLLAGPVDPTRKARALKARNNVIASQLPASPASPVTNRTIRRAEYPCPIPGCQWIFYGSRGGWDGHVESLRKHPDWHRRVSDPGERKRIFKQQYAAWFGRLGQ